MSFRFHDPNSLVVDFEQVIISIILFTVLFFKQIMISSKSLIHVPLVLSRLLKPDALAADFEETIVLVNCFMVICFLSWVLTRY